MVSVFMGKIHDVGAFNYMFSGDGLFCSRAKRSRNGEAGWEGELKP
jgi:hypothetical protein